MYAHQTPSQTVMLIGISGKKRSGKDTVGEIMLEWLQGNLGTAARVAFADQLKEEVARATGVSLEQIESDKVRWRPILQWWGVEFRRHYFGQDYWLRKMVEKLLTMDEEFAVVTDVRFRDEADYIRASGGFVVRVERETGLQDGHVSELNLDGYDDFDYVLNNHKDIDSLELKVDRVLTDALLR